MQAAAEEEEEAAAGLTSNSSNRAITAAMAAAVGAAGEATLLVGAKTTAIGVTQVEAGEAAVGEAARVAVPVRAVGAVGTTVSSSSSTALLASRCRKTVTHGKSQATWMLTLPR
jgi:hypothetical protein